MTLMQQIEAIFNGGYAIRDARCGRSEIRSACFQIRQSRISHRASRISHPVSRIAYLVSRISPLVLLAVIVPATAVAHEQAGTAAGFLSGFAHPIYGLDHVIAMVAVGLWGAQLGMPAVVLLPIVFPVVMAMGGMLGLLGVPLPGIEIGIAVSAVVLGALVLGSAKPPIGFALLAVGFFAIFHGHAHGTELPPGQSGLFYSIGFVMATGLLHAFGISIGLVHRWPMGRVALRTAGAMVSIAGLVFLWRAVS